MRVTTRTPNLRKSVTRQSAASIGADALSFLIALASPFSVRFVGSLPVAEIILIPLVPVLWVLRKRQPAPPMLKTIFLLMGFWLCSQILTDIYRETPAVDWMRGDAEIAFFAMDLAGLFVLLAGSDRRKVRFFIGLAIGDLLVVRLEPTRSSLEDPWKFGYSSGTILLVVLISCFFYSRRKYMVVGSLFVGIIGVNLIKNYRSPILILLIAMVLVLPIIPEQIGRLRLLPRAGIKRVAVLAGMALGAGWSASALVHLATSARLVSEEAQAKNEEQFQAGRILLGGRPEILVSSRAVMESPILGHGSWAKDYKYEEMLSDILVEQGMQANLRDMEATSGGQIPGHSHLMNAWLWAGFLGAVFWAYIFWLVIKGIVRVSILRPSMAPLYAFLLVEYFWAILFSPLANTMRMYESMVIVIMLDLFDSAPNLVSALAPLRKRQWRRQALTVRRA